MTEKQIKILHDAVKTYGKNSQVDKAIEEMAELTKELLKERQNDGSAEHLREELADVLIMVCQLIIIYDTDDLDDYVDCKINRLEKRLKKTE